MDLSKLSRQEKLDLLDLTQKREELLSRRPIDRYTPHPRQLDFHQSPAKIRLLCGGNRSGKSHAGVAEDVWFVLGIHPHRHNDVPRKLWICGPDFPSWARGVMIKKLHDMLPKDSIRKITKNHEGVETIWELVNGSIIEVKVYTQETASYESADVDGIHWDEPPPKDKFEAASRGLVDRGGSHWFTLTPISEPWLYRDLWLNAELPRVATFQMTTYDNPHLDPQSINEFKDTLTEEAYKARILGEFKQLQGRVFKLFDSKTHVIDGFWPQRGWPVYRAIDPHVYGRKNQAALWLTITPNGDYVCYDELWSDLTIEQLRDAIIDHDHQPGKVPVNLRVSVMDTSINVREAIGHRNFRDLFLAPGKYGRRLQFMMANKRNLVNPGLEYINTLLESRLDPKTRKVKPRLYVDRRCERLIEEFELHNWHDFKNPEVSGLVEREEKTYNDLISCLRYILNTNPEYLKEHQYLKLPISSSPYGR